MALSRCCPLFRNFACVNVQHAFPSLQLQSGSRLLGEHLISRPTRFLQRHPESCNRIVTRSFRQRKAPVIQTQAPPPSETFPVFKSFLYVTGVCSCSFLGAMLWNYENMRKYVKMMNDIRINPKGNTPSKNNVELKRHLELLWSQVWTFGIVAANAGVWIMWNIPRLQATMIKFFSSAPGRPLAAMTLSSFSHISFIHLFVNMYVLISFLPLTPKLFGREHFAAFYLSAGTVSAFTSLAVNKFLRRPNLMSVGASGAIMGLLGAIAVTYPDIKLQVAFVSEIFPHSFSASTGLTAIIAFDLLGLALGWRVLDHAGHLGGVIFGILYAKYGKSLVWGTARERIIKSWHELRGKP